jgi:hypothetical protein
MLDCSENEACMTARKELEAARNNIIELCSTLASLKVERDNARTMAAQFGAMAAVWFAIAAATAAIPVLGWVVSAIPAAIAVSFLVSQIFFLGIVNRFTQQIKVTEGKLDEAREAFQSAVEKVMGDCPSGCWGELVMPTC